jgi:hypothetical protein
VGKNIFAKACPGKSKATAYISRGEFLATPGAEARFFVVRFGKTEGNESLIE